MHKLIYRYIVQAWHSLFTPSVQDFLRNKKKKACGMDGAVPPVDNADNLEDGQLEDEEGEISDSAEIDEEIVRNKIGSDISDGELDFGDADGPASPVVRDLSQDVYSSDGELPEESEQSQRLIPPGSQLGGLDTEDISADSAPASPEAAAELSQVFSPSQGAEPGTLDDSFEDTPEAEPGGSVDGSAGAAASNGHPTGETSEETPHIDSAELISHTPGHHANKRSRKHSHKHSKKHSQDQLADIKINFDTEKSLGDNQRTVYTVGGEEGEPGSRTPEPVNGDVTDKLNSSFSKATLHDDHGELDYDEELGEDEVQKKPVKPEEELEEGEEVSDPEEEKDDISSNLSSSDGEVEDDDDCEEGEIKEPGDQSPRPFVKQLCRFYQRNVCTWGDNCRFLHPGVNDKGNYSLIERSLPGIGGSIRGGQWVLGGVPLDELPPPPDEPVTESAWERGLRQAKELRKLASKRKETDANFEEKRMTLSIPVEEDREFNKENDRRPFPKDPYYDNVYEEDDEYYNTKVAEHYQRGHFENIEVRWTREADYDFRRPPGPPGPPPVHRMESPDHSLRERSHRHHHHHRSNHNRPPGPPPPHMGLPPPRQRLPEPLPRMSPPPDRRFDRRKERPPPEKFERVGKFEKPQKRLEERPDGSAAPQRPTRGDEWHDPWQRSKSPKRGRASRSRSRGRKPRYRSSSGSSSSYSSSSSRSSRSRSSSYSSYSSGSSYSGSGSSSYSSRSRSPSPRKNKPRPVRRKHPPLAARPIPIRDMPVKLPLVAKPLAAKPVPVKPAALKPLPSKMLGHKPGDPPKSTVALKAGLLKPVRPPAGIVLRGSASASKMGPMPLSAPPGGPPAKPVRPPTGELPAAAPPGGPPPARARKKDKTNIRQRRNSSSSSGSSRSRSRSFSSSRSRSRSSSVSSMSSSSSNASSGSADSEHLYRDIDPINNKKEKATPKKKKEKPPAPAKQPSAAVKHPERASHPMPARVTSRPAAPRAARPAMPGPQIGAAGAPLKTAKDPLKVLGQKSNIKLSLINKSAEKPPVAKKRPAPDSNNMPPAKKQAKAVTPKADKAPPARPEKPVKPVSAKTKPETPKMPAVPSPVKKPAEPVKVAPPAKPAPSPVKAKKSTSSRREELLKQLKAVEDAIARKRAKLQ